MKKPKQWRFFWSGTQTLNSFRSLEYARDNKSITFFYDLCKPIEMYIYARKKHPFNSYPAAKHPRHSKFAITDMKNQQTFFLVRHGRRL